MYALPALCSVYSKNIWLIIYLKKIGVGTWVKCGVKIPAPNALSAAFYIEWGLGSDSTERIYRVSPISYYQNIKP